jgi:hypothetical protein
MVITNDGGAPTTITGIDINWLDEPSSQSVVRVEFNGVTILNADDPLPPSSYPSEKNWAGTQSDLELAASDSKLLVFLFSEDLQAGGYSVTVTFDDVCTVDGSN